jgi:hypothetical protein
MIVTNLPDPGGYGRTGTPNLPASFRRSYTTIREKI